MVTRIIFLCGMDGTGKSTWSAIIGNALRQKGHSIKRSYYSRGFFFLSSFLLLISRATSCTVRVKLANGKTTITHNFRRNRFLSMLWLCWFSIDSAIYFMYQLLKIKILSLRYNDLVVIYERSVIDTIADIINDTGLEEYAKSLTRMASLIMRMTRESPLIMLFDVEPKVAYERKDDVPNISFLRDHREAYKLIMKYFPTPIPIDTGRPCYENISKILQVVSNYLQNS